MARSLPSVSWADRFSSLLLDRRTTCCALLPRRAPHDPSYWRASRCLVAALLRLGGAALLDRILELQLVEGVVDASVGDEFFVGSDLSHAAVLQYDDSVRLADRL